MLKILTVFLGVFVIISRGYAVLFTEHFRELMMKLAGNLSYIRRLGAILLVFCILLFAALGNDFSGARAVMAILGFIWFFGGLVLMALPAIYAAMVKWFLKLPDAAWRPMAGIGVCVGILIVWLGISYY